MLLTVVNTRLQTIISANDDMTVESAKQYLKDIFNGKMGVIAEQKLFDSLKVNNANTKNNNISDLIELEQYIKASLYNEIGLSANYNMKKERLINAEVEQNTDILYPLIDDMMECRQQAINEINELYGLDIKIKFSSSWGYKNKVNEEVEEDEEDGEVIEETETVEEVEEVETDEEVIEEDKKKVK